ncbi:MAG: hypothetical protein LBR66_03270 [Candidatus Symbiothrix sp.]|jgi:hypothetical protein|nr:hypothetical protein [Candidatus Symbiothrix sp.]
MKKIILILAIALLTGGALTAQAYWGQTQRMERQSQVFNKRLFSNEPEKIGESGALRGDRTKGETAPTDAEVPVGGGSFCSSH